MSSVPSYKSLPNDPDNNATFGENGWYYETSPDRYTVIVTCHKLLNKHFNPFTDWRYPPGQEQVVYLNGERFRELRMLNLLKVDLRRQLELERKHRDKAVDLSRFAPITHEGSLSYRYIRFGNGSENGRGRIPAAVAGSVISNIRDLRASKSAGAA